MRLQARWRQWLARTLISRWLADRHFYQLSIVQTEAENPEARIAEDGRYAIELLVDFSLGVINATLVAISFISILWVVGGSLTVFGISIPGYSVNEIDNPRWQASRLQQFHDALEHKEGDRK